MFSASAINAGLFPFVFVDLSLWSYIRGFPGGSDGKDSACNAGDPGSISGLGRSPGEGNGTPFQYSCLENSMERGAWGGLQSMESQRIGHDWVTNPLFGRYSLWSYVVLSRIWMSLLCWKPERWLWAGALEPSSSLSGLIWILSLVLQAFFVDLRHFFSVPATVLEMQLVANRRLIYLYCLHAFQSFFLAQFFFILLAHGNSL